MAAYFNRECPHCGHKTTFQVQGNYSAVNSTFALGNCMACHRPVVACFNGGVPLSQIQDNTEASGYPVVNSWPEGAPISCPEHAPERPKNLYLQGIDNQRRQNWDAAGMAFRTCLDRALRRLHPEGKGTLAKRIDDLPGDTGVTPSMKEWAHQIRTLGNDAAHEDEPFDETSTKDLQSFTEVFLMYAFTLPGMLTARRADKP
jgi:Domain of unknown function (DUF4145)